MEIAKKVAGGVLGVAWWIVSRAFIVVGTLAAAHMGIAATHHRR